MCMCLHKKKNNESNLETECTDSKWFQASYEFLCLFWDNVPLEGRGSSFRDGEAGLWEEEPPFQLGFLFVCFKLKLLTIYNRQAVQKIPTSAR